MAILGKITRILWKTVKYLIVLIVLLFVFIIIAVNTESLQTWLAQQATTYMSSKLGTRVEVGRVHINLIRDVELENVFVEDHIHDTLLYSKLIKVKLSNFDYKKQTLNIDKVTLTKTKGYIVRHKGQEDFNFQHLIDLFSSADTTTKPPSQPWTIKYGTLVLDDVDFIYRNERYNVDVSENMNYQNIKVTHAFGQIHNIKIIDGTIYGDIENLKAHEQCGIDLLNLTTRAKISDKFLICKNLDLTTAHSHVQGTMAFKYHQWSDYIEFIDSVKIEGMVVAGTHVSFKDIAYFAKELNGLDKDVIVNGKMDGFVKDFKAESVYLKYGENSLFTGDLHMKGLPDMNSTFIDLKAQYLGVSKADLESVPLYPFYEKDYLSLPNEVGRLGVMSFKGKFQGYYHNFITKGNFKTALGSAETDLAVRIDTAKGKVSYDGLLITDNFNLGKLLNVPDLGSVSLNSKVKGSGLTLKELDAVLNGKINAIAYNNYVYQDITINGNIKNKIFNGELKSRDNNANLDFSGKMDFTDKIPDFDFIATINKLNLKRLGFIKSEQDGAISTQLLITLKGDNIDNMSGLINFDNTIYKTAEKEYKISTFDLNLDQEKTEKSIKLNSNIFNLAVNGPFKLSNMQNAFNHFLYAYYPAFVAKPKTKPGTDAFKYKLTIKKFTPIRELFLNDLMISANSVFDGDFDATKNIFNLNLKSDSIKYKSIRFNNSRIESYSKNNKVNLVFKSDKIDLTDSISIKNYFMYVVSQDKNSKFNLEWNNKSVPNNAGKLFGRAIFENKTATFSFEQFFLTARDSTWNMITSNNTFIDSTGSLLVNPLVFANGNQKLSINGALSNAPKDKLLFQLANFDLNQLSPFIGDALKVRGTVDGDFALHKNMGDITFSSNLQFNKLNINDNNLGEGVLNSEYFPSDKYIYLDGYTSLGFTNFNGDKIKNISFNGYYYLDKKDENLDINFEANPANLNILNRYLAGIITLKPALIVGKAKITGTPSKPLINGKFKVTNCELKVDYLNVTYNVIGNVEVYPDQIKFEDLKIGDDVTKKNVFNGTLNGNIFHDNFKNMRIDYDVNFKNMLVMNLPRTETSAYYGKAYATGNAGIFGFINKIDMQINGKTEKGTVFTIPLDNPSEVEEKGFIRFVVKDTIKKVEQPQASGFTLDMNITATPDAEAQIIFDEKSGDVIKARGKGELNLKISTWGKFDMFGEYAINSGDYMFTLENFITKKFEIQKGSTINWSGNPYDADLNITANYKQRASIAPLFPGDSSGAYKRRYPVDCKLYMKESLLNPIVSFGLELPTIDDNTRSKIKSLMIDEVELNRQVFSLLLLKSFITPIQYTQGGGISNAAGSALAATGTEMLSNRLTGWLSNLTNDVDVGVNYRPGSQMSNDELDIALSKQLLNNRLSVDGSFGYNSSNSASTSNNSTGLIGDVSVEYKITEDGRYRVKGFNRSNDNTQVTTQGGLYTQGVGAFYREEFEDFDDVWKRYYKKMQSWGKKKNKPTETPAGTN